MSKELSAEEVATVTVLLQSGKTIKEITKFVDFDSDAVTKVARNLDLTPATEVQRRAKLLYGTDEALTFQQIAQRLAGEGFTSDDDEPLHHLTIASWVKNYGWPWGGAADGNYAPPSAASPTVRSRYVLRLSAQLAEQVNTPAKITDAAAHAWQQLNDDKTRIVQLAIIRGAAHADVTDLAAVKHALLDTYGEQLRSAKAD